MTISKEKYPIILVILLTLLASVLGTGCPSHHEKKESSKGPIHLWTPDGYVPFIGGTIVYVHGYYTDVDKAWEEHKLSEQFANSGVNALFIAVEAPANDGEPVYWKTPEALEKELGWKLPPPVTIVAHSGGFRTAWRWSKYDVVERIILLDGFYGAYDEFLNFAERGGILVLVGIDTANRAKRFFSKYNVDVIFVNPEHTSHMGIVTSGKYMPELIREWGGAPRIKTND